MKKIQISIGILVARKEIMMARIYSARRCPDAACKAIPALFVTFLVCLLVFPTKSIHCQIDPYGQTDSVVVENKLIEPNSYFKIKVTLNNDEEVGGFTIPLNYDGSVILFDSVSFVNSRARHWQSLLFSHSQQNKTILFGGLAVGEPNLSAGSGIIAELYFHAAPGANNGDGAVVDSGFIPPAGEFLISSVEGYPFRPAFRAGNIVVGPTDLPPVFEPLSRLVASEGDTVSVDIHAADPERATIKLSAGKLPSGAKFTDYGIGSGRFTFRVPYIGTGSSLGSPLRVNFSASDGHSVSQTELEIEILNTNRPPEFVTTDTVSAGSGDSVYIPLEAADPDFEAVTFSASGLPPGALLHPQNPGYIVWASAIADSGFHQFAVSALDESGGQTDGNVSVRLLPTVPVELTISQAQGFSSERVDVVISMHNRVEISAFSLLIKYDPTAVTLLSVESEGTRTEDWLVFNSNASPDGRIFMNGVCNPFDSTDGALPAGDGAIAALSFFISSDIGFAGFYVAVSFDFLNAAEDDEENIVYGPDGHLYGHTQVNLTSGGILIKKYEGLIGDINLNGIPFEVADLVYFTNYFINPVAYPLDGERWGNSDINQDGRPGTLGDLIYMISIIRDGNGKMQTPEIGKTVEYTTQSLPDGIAYRLVSDAEIAGARYTFRIADSRPAIFAASPAISGMAIMVQQDGEYLRALIYSPTAGSFKAFGEELFRVDGSEKVDLVFQEYVDKYGSTLTATKHQESGSLPREYALEQNYPNPFNPQTTISFDLPRPGLVRLSIFNILGEEIAVLVNGPLSAGRHQAVFEGKDDQGREFSSGIYFYRFRSGEHESVKKMVLIK